MTPRSTLMLLLRLAMSAGLLVFLFIWVEIDFALLVPSDATAVLWLVAALCCATSSMALASLRWQQVCRALGLRVSTRRLLRHTSAGLFLSNFVPTTVGGDVLRVTRLGRDTGDRPTSFTTVILERLSGWLVLPAVIVVGLLLDPHLRELGAATRGALIAAVVTLVALLLIIVAAGNDYSGRVLERYEESLAWLHAVHEGIEVLRAKPREVGRILWTGLMYQTILIMAFWCAAQSIGVEGFGIRAALAFIPAVLIVQVLPLGIGGLGVREGALVVFLGSLDVPKDQSVALGLTVYALTIVVSLVGLPWLVFNKKGENTALVDAGDSF